MESRTTSLPIRSSTVVPLLTVLGISAALVWAYLPILTIMVDRWTYDPRYAHGYLVPAFAAVLLWLRRDRIKEGELRMSWLGVPLIGLGAGLKIAAGYAYNDWLDAVSLIVTIAGGFALVGGLKALRWSWPAVAFLLFMVPLPFRLEMALGWPLQRLATIASTFVLQTVGFPAVGEGNIIRMTQSTLGVAEACSGLSMMLLFFALSTGVAILIDRPWLDKLVIIASAVPIALIVNVARITVTGILSETVGEELSSFVYHDLAGFLMIPLALLLLGVELWFLSHAFVEDHPADSQRGRLAPVEVGPATRTSAEARKERRPPPLAPIITNASRRDHPTS
ncbi:exosortase/archaeosortase family protein [Tautonia rosea]|uniref:exosortase/archaeosortase family protein n=1 Tax=Tautonia rosea TaxID=2728037 RepID=UPI001475D940|nr:exosortase/archaeosortase family protein [Tautonia rosea]